MTRLSKYLILYLTIVFTGWWGTALCFFLYQDSLIKLVGELTLLHPLIIFLTYLPSLTGLAIFYLMGGLPGVKLIISKLIPRKQDIFLFPLIFLIFIIFIFSMRFGCWVLNIPLPPITLSIYQGIVEILVNFVRETGIIGGVFGWVAFLLPCLQSKLKNNILSGLLTGSIFGLWLLPGFALSATAADTSYLLYVLQLMTFFVCQSYIFNYTKGSLVFYLFTFALISAGSHIQLYYFTVPIQIMQIVFFAGISLIMHMLFRKNASISSLQILEMFTYKNIEAKQS